MKKVTKKKLTRKNSFSSFINTKKKIQTKNLRQKFQAKVEKKGLPSPSNVTNFGEFSKIAY